MKVYNKPYIRIHDLYGRACLMAASDPMRLHDEESSSEQLGKRFLFEEEHSCWSEPANWEYDF